jgi:hypothetical protein
MPRYFFNLNDGRKIIPDLEGTALLNDESARAHATEVVRELAQNREHTTRSWRLAVCDAHGTLYFELSFASVADATSGSPPVTGFEEACPASLSDAMLSDAMLSDAMLGDAMLGAAIERVKVLLRSYPPAGEGREGEDLGAA